MFFYSCFRQSFLFCFSLFIFRPACFFIQATNNINLTKFKRFYYSIFAWHSFQKPIHAFIISCGRKFRFFHFCIQGFWLCHRFLAVHWFHLPFYTFASLWLLRFSLRHKLFLAIFDFFSFPTFSQNLFAVFSFCFVPFLDSDFLPRDLFFFPIKDISHYPIYTSSIYKPIYFNL